MLSNSSNQQHWCDSKMWSVVQIHYEVFRRISESAGKLSAYRLKATYVKLNATLLVEGRISDYNSRGGLYLFTGI